MPTLRMWLDVKFVCVASFRRHRFPIHSFYFELGAQQRFRSRFVENSRRLRINDDCVVRIALRVDGKEEGHASCNMIQNVHCRISWGGPTPDFSEW